MRHIANSKQTLSAIQGFDSLPNSAHVRLPVVQALFACSDDTVYRAVAAGRIAPPRRLTSRSNVWNVGELRRALAAAA